ncbi:DUF2589 domain-containing protein [Pseudomonas guariconensis]|uniref:DUF2589 domain-containing protein n=1 Tax=Pseudomonas TaxID=286 RepID=UPI001CE4211C|nr:MULTISPECIES: DUF2589 domain-containing protein [Pseudomonas]MCO7638585.1 DUF2589 domain-containing protein [Pseudomonas sp. S 311-6]MCO7513844.1 DUF2589 domain-containing protein [Pseudomonas putida]MCO7565887.1 DUF2589 domain-containing protein [Pseudomonas mosselii]MCO7595544.1 DUF2589 domain-containing protein [Pseudomonas guariconensis]MCO7605353.1 DUF2589 domain-containing protein [Pseudomonas guariconensis]
MTSSDLSDITRGLQEAAAATNTLVAQQYIRLFDQFFDYDPNALGSPMKAKMVEVAMDGQHSLQIPLITLVSPRGLALERMQVDLSVRVNGLDAGAAVESGAVGGTRFQVTVGAGGRRTDQRDPDEVQIRMQFQACEPPEAINRLIEEYTNLILPRRQPAPAATDEQRNEFIDAATVR